MSSAGDLQQLIRAPGFRAGDAPDDKAVFFDGQTLVIQLNGVSAGANAFEIRCVDPTTNTTTKILTVGHDGTVKITAGSISLTYNSSGLDLSTGGTVKLTNAGGTIGSFGAAAVVKQAVSGSKGANAALTSLMAALVAYGLVTDNTT